MQIVSLTFQLRKFASAGITIREEGFLLDFNCRHLLTHQGHTEGAQHKRVSSELPKWEHNMIFLLIFLIVNIVSRMADEENSARGGGGQGEGVAQLPQPMEIEAEESGMVSINQYHAYLDAFSIHLTWQNVMSCPLLGTTCCCKKTQEAWQQIYLTKGKRWHCQKAQGKSSGWTVSWRCCRGCWHRTTFSNNPGCWGHWADEVRQYQWSSPVITQQNGLSEEKGS